MNIVKVISTELNDLSQRFIKYLRFGRNDVQTSVEAMPYGTDANPIKDMVAIYAETGEKGETVILGYLNKSQLAAVGEHRIFSTDSGGVISTFIHLKNDGTMEVGGGSDFMVRYSALQTEFDEMKGKLNDHIANWNTFANAYVAGSPSVVGLPPTAAASTESSADITLSKIPEIKTI